MLINKAEDVGIKHWNDSKAFIEYSNNIDNIYKNIKKDNPNKIREILIVFDDMIADMLSNEKLNSVVTEFFIRGRKLNLSLVFIKRSYFKVPKHVRLNTKFQMKENLNKLHIIINQVLTLKTLWIFTKNVL